MPATLLVPVILRPASCMRSSRLVSGRRNWPSGKSPLAPKRSQTPQSEGNWDGSWNQWRQLAGGGAKQGRDAYFSTVPYITPCTEDEMVTSRISCWQASRPSNTLIVAKIIMAPSSSFQATLDLARDIEFQAICHHLPPLGIFLKLDTPPQRKWIRFMGRPACTAKFVNTPDLSGFNPVKKALFI
ncbi:hypothetical protein CISG_01210 [Coccidioides immitis RMSCC 3703]|uniref:Uncharacterized protein n=2 Tax=Coccidioides immitis TaxID=5501 RepID=A0A0J8TRU7_COCIT|nr:hypothetical protein CIRG_01686 [Coccidioides immitis RMSCC 2394]KMU76477.1 hypothetical protein CISG_01210 [Coccidioides immitis RMSCC 3703]